MTDEIANLRGMMENLHNGRVVDTGPVEEALALAWNQIAGTEAESTDASKIYGRTETMEWSPPTLSFVIERHGATLYGSSRADLRKWTVKLDNDAIRERDKPKVELWKQMAGATEMPSEIRSFVSGIERDWAEVCAAVEHPYSNGRTEGHVNRLKLIKRKMYGRAKFDLLRIRVLARGPRSDKADSVVGHRTL